MKSDDNGLVLAFVRSYYHAVKDFFVFSIMHKYM